MLNFIFKQFKCIVESDVVYLSSIHNRCHRTINYYFGNNEHFKLILHGDKSLTLVVDIISWDGVTFISNSQSVIYKLATFSLVLHRFHTVIYRVNECSKLKLIQ